ncbi:AI-2E family transporter [Nakamurella flava]|uniref:AI-2E family transporter n=1 Tax=Nakamurella flava TaxID=2576308 RepID=A0A4U6Q7U9_9ACTN|nr:AI-2E family transporter [Nakamurella flava]TKV56168.1 AI-2E family transporter [Nakamurella flava]
MPEPIDSPAARATDAAASAHPEAHPDDGFAAPPAVSPAADPPAPLMTALPRGLVVMLALASLVVVGAGIRAVPDIVGPVFLALVLTITVEPIRGWMVRHGAPRWLATLAVVVGVYAIIIGLVASAVIGIAQFASILPQYADQMTAQIAGLRQFLAGFGISPDRTQDLVGHLDSSKVVSVITALLSAVGSVLSSLFFVVTLLIFLAVDGAVFGERMERVRQGREPALGALSTFAVGTRKYFGVSTVFGAIVAVLDWAALLLLGIPAAGLWGLLAFVTNYIPNIGFIIGIVPPALLALLVGGPGLMIAVVVVYCVLNFVIQSVLQPKFVGDAVGLTTTVSFLSLIVWSYLLGPIGAVLAIPASLLVKALLIDVDPDARWLQLFLGDEPVFKPKDPNRGPWYRRRPSGTP